MNFDACAHAFRSYLFHPSCCPLAYRALPHARALTNNYLTKQLVDAFFCFEALTDYPYSYFSYKHGYFPLLSQWDGCNKPAVNISMEEYFRVRTEQVIDMDLDWFWLIISMLSPMVFRETLQFSYNTPITFCPQNRKSNVITIPARGKARKPGDVEAADGEALVHYVKENGEGEVLEEMLDSMKMDDLEALYRLCFGKKGPGMSRCVDELKHGPLMLLQIFAGYTSLSGMLRWKRANCGDGG